MILYLPISHNGDLSFLDALFTSTSALCVTGLIVVDTPTKYTLFGKTVISLLILAGGLGYMTLTAFILSATKTKGSLYARKLVVETLGTGKLGGVLSFASNIVLYSLIIQTLAILPLFLSFIRESDTFDALFNSIFHSISAFNNAGFSNFSNSLMDYSEDPLVNLTVMILIVVGGIGFKVWMDVKERRLTLHSKIVILTTLILIALPFLFFYTFEEQTKGSILKSLFASITRTAGFSTVDYSKFSDLSLFLTMTLMFVGGSPGSTAGGIRTVTLALVFLWVINTLRGNRNVVAFRREIPQEVIVRAFQTLVLAVFLIWLWIFALSISEREILEKVGILRLSFEVISALCTVGLSTGSITTPNVSLSADFSLFGKIMIMSGMIIGRAGYLVFATSLITPRKVNYRFAKGEVVL
ncbi:MAG: TrkH family potassium uptake protein [Candidatus Caldipriscus sp.]